MSPSVETQNKSVRALQCGRPYCDLGEATSTSRGNAKPGCRETVPEDVHFAELIPRIHLVHNHATHLRTGT